MNSFSFKFKFEFIFFYPPSPFHFSLNVMFTSFHLSLNVTFTFFSFFVSCCFFSSNFARICHLRYSRSIFVFLAVSIMLCNLSNSDRYFSSSSELITADVSTCSQSFWNLLILIFHSFCNLLIVRN